jgi:hypothetical protein
MTFGSRGGRVHIMRSSKERPTEARPVEDVVRDLKKAQEKPPGEDYRDRSLAIHGLICARCAREFDESNRQLLTVHHKDGNHHNNPADGSNWENLCIYCHEDIHSRELLGEYMDGAAGGKESPVVHESGSVAGEPGRGLATLGEKLKKALEAKKKEE